MMAHAVKNMPAMQETWVELLEMEMETHSSILAWRMDRGAWQTTVRRRVAKNQTHLCD